MARYLSRHGVRVEVVVERTCDHAGAGGVTVGGVLQSLARASTLLLIAH